MGFTQAKGIYLPNTALKKDVREITMRTSRRRVTAIFVKHRDDCLYRRLTYIAKGLTIDDEDFVLTFQSKVDKKGLVSEFPLPRKETPSLSSDIDV